jgi:uncharacterized OB-fold protein
LPANPETGAAGAGRFTATRPRPAITPDNRFFWDGVQAKRLLIQRCRCARLRHPPGPMCPACHSFEWTATEADGSGSVYSFAVAHHPQVPPFDYPNVIALVELCEGTRIVSNLVGVDPTEVVVGMRVRAIFPELETGRRFLQFELDRE